MPNVFSERTEIGTSFAAKAAIMQFNNVNGRNDGVGAVRTFNGTMARQVSQLYNLLDEKVYYVQGRSTGNAACNTVIGPKHLTSDFLRQFSDVCNVASNHIVLTLPEKCGNNTVVRYTLEGVVLTSFAFAIDVGTMLVSDTLNFIITNMSIDD